MTTSRTDGKSICEDCIFKSYDGHCIINRYKNTDVLITNCQDYVTKKDRDDKIIKEKD